MKMANIKPISEGHKNKNGTLKLKNAVRKLKKSIKLRWSSSSEVHDDSANDYVPEDVKEGHFGVIAMDGEETRRFVVPLCFLSHPTFVKLLEKAAEEYGFDRVGALTVPCPPNELQMILADNHKL